MDSLPVPTHSAEEVENADFKAVLQPSSTTIFPVGASRGEKVQHLARSLPSNDYGLPMFYVRSDLLDWTRIEAYGFLRQEDIDCAVEALTYDDGYPIQKAGSPWWVQLNHEPFDAYQLFRSFLSLAETDGIRLLDTLSLSENVELEHIRELSLEYYWSSRARAYDLFIVAAEAKRREHRTRKMENEHYNVAGGLLEAIIKRFNDEPDLIQKMDAADLLDAFDRMVKVQRLSLGLTGAQASTNTNLPMTPGASVEVTLRQLTQNAGLSGQAQDNFSDRVKLLMADEGTALAAQELVIKATTNNLVHNG